MNAWITFWAVVLSVGLVGYYLVALVVIPLGALDIRRMFARLDEAGKSEEECEMEEES